MSVRIDLHVVGVHLHFQMRVQRTHADATVLTLQRISCRLTDHSTAQTENIGCRVKADTFSKSKYGSVLSQVGGWAWFQDLLSALDGIAQKHNSTISNVACRWTLDRPQVAGLIVGARNANHVQDHQRLMNLELDQADRDAIQDVLDTGRQPKGDVYAWERGGVF